MANNQSYFEFENQFRGKTKQVITNFDHYLGLIRTIQKTNLNPNHLDIGCGKGEWLELCKNEGFNSLGIDNNKDMVNTALDNGLNVIHGDLITVLKTLPADSFDLISGFHIVEHLTFETIISLLCECQRLLSNSGILLLETPNIDNLTKFSRLLYLDPNTINLINPESMVFHIEQIGFHKVEYFFINGGPLQPSSDHTLTRVLNGISQDVCFIATKTEKCTNHLFLTSHRWQLEINQSISTLDAAHDHDNYIRQLEIKINSLEEAILMLRTNQITFEKANISFSTWRDSLNNNYLVKGAKILNKILNLSKKFFIKLVKILFVFLRKIDINILLRFILGRQNLVKAINKVMIKFGFRDQADKLMQRSDQAKLYNSESDESNKYLLRYYHSSELAKQVFQRLDSTESTK